MLFRRLFYQKFCVILLGSGDTKVKLGSPVLAIATVYLSFLGPLSASFLIWELVGDFCVISLVKPHIPPSTGKQVPVNNGFDEITAVFYFQPGGVDEGKVITYNGVKKTLPENSNFPAKLSCTFGKINKWPITFDGKYATLQVDIASDGTMSNAKFDPNLKTSGGNLNIN